MVLPFEAIYSTAHLESILAISFSLPLLYNKYTYRTTALIHRTLNDFTVSPTVHTHTYCV